MLVALAALLDPGTPEPILRSLGEFVRHAPGRALLLAHPNAPADRTQTAVHLGATDVGPALLSPASTDVTRARVLAGVDDQTLLELVLDHRPAHPAAFSTLSTRMLAGDFHARDTSDLIAYPRVSAPVQLAALRIAVTQPGAHPLVVATAATAHADSLRELAELASQANLRQELTQLAAQHDAGSDVRATRIQVARAAMLAAPTTDRLLATFDTTPVAELAAFVLDRGPEAAHVITASPSLTDTPEWRRARLLPALGHVPGPDDHIPADPDMADATLATRAHVIAVTSYQPLTGTSEVLAAGADALARTTCGDAGEHLVLAEHCIRLLAHPATPPDRLEAVSSALRTHITKVTHYDMREYLANDHIAKALADGQPFGELVAHAPARTLVEASALDLTLADCIAFHARAHVRQLWDTPEAVHVALTLERTFPGTLAELTSTARSVMR